MFAVDPGTFAAIYYCLTHNWSSWTLCVRSVTQITTMNVWIQDHVHGTLMSHVFKYIYSLQYLLRCYGSFMLLRSNSLPSSCHGGQTWLCFGVFVLPDSACGIVNGKSIVLDTFAKYLVVSAHTKFTTIVFDMLETG